MLDLVFLAGVLLVALGVGRRWLRAVPFPWSLEEGVFALALGLGAIGYLTLALGEARWLTRPSLIGVLGIAAMWSRREIGAALAIFARGVRRWRDSRPGPSERAAVVIGGALLIAEVAIVLAPAVGGDQTKYHLVYPRLFAAAHRLVDTPWSFWGYVQYLPNMLFTAAFVLRGDVLARLLSATFGVLSTLAVFSLSRRAFGRWVAIWATILFATMPLSVTLMIRAWVEPALTTYVLLAVLAIMAWHVTEASSWLALAAVMGGFATGSKVMGVLVPACLATFIFARTVSRGGRRRVARALAAAGAFGLIAGLVASPCYLRNAVSTGNPIYPFGYGVFGGRDWSPEAARGLDAYYAAYRETGAQKRAGGAYTSWLETLRFPWDVTMAPHSFEEAGRSAYDIGPFILAFAPGILLLRRDATAWALVALGMTYGATVVFGMWPHPRYVHPALPIVLVVAVRVVDRLRGYGAWSSRAVTGLLAMTVLGQAALCIRVLAPLWPDSVRVAVAHMSEEEFLSRHERRYALWKLVNAEVPRDGNVLILGMIPHPYHVERRFTLASPLEQGAIDYRRIGNVDALVAALERFGVTHVVREQEPLKAATNPVGARVELLWEGLLARCEKVGSATTGESLYRLPTGAQSATPKGSA